jgi:magnesium transporter
LVRRDGPTKRDIDLPPPWIAMAQGVGADGLLEQLAGADTTTLSHQRVVRASEKTGLPPGSLVYVGERPPAEPVITLIRFGPEGYDERPSCCIDDAFPLDPAWPVTWIDVVGLDPRTVRSIGDRLGVHPLVLEDMLNTRARPKLDVFEDHVYLSLKTIGLEEPEARLRTEQVSIVFGRNVVVSVQESPGDVLEPVRDRIRRDGRIRELGADYLAYALVDVVVDGYFAVLERLDERGEYLEEQVLMVPTPETLRDVHELKRGMVEFRHALWPLRELVLRFERESTPLIDPSVVVFYRDVYDHTVQMIETVESLRDVVAGMLDIYLSSVSYRLNEIIKVLTIFSTIFMPLTFIVGVYGMNFRYLPELGYTWAYPALWVVMIGIVVTMLLYFRRRRWI